MAAYTQAQLDDARNAYHELLTGKSARVFVDQNGERVEFTSANRQSLAQYIAELQRCLQQGNPAGPMNVWL